MRVAVLVFFLLVVFVGSEGRSLSNKEFAMKRARERRSATCTARGQTYKNGDEIVYHNITKPVENAMCTSCQCSGGTVSACRTYHCDVGLSKPLIRACEQWKTGVEGKCCPRCVCSHAGKRLKDGDSWVRRLSPTECYECSCRNSTVACGDLVWCPSCDGVEIKVVGKCCPHCHPATTRGFTITTTTTPAYPNFPSGFPWPFDEK